MDNQRDNQTAAGLPKIPGGYFIIARKLFDGELMSKPPLHVKLWAWMLNAAFWKDGEKLRRGQFHTSISDMQNAMSYKVGYRKVTPTKDEIRSAYEAFTKATMITTAKTTRGMVITISNYSLYQDFKNYEAHSEAHNENPTKPTVTPQDREGRFKERSKESKTSSSSSDEADGQEVAFYLTKKKKKLSGKRLDSFNEFWTVFDYRQGKAEAADAWLDIPTLTTQIVEQIIIAAKSEAQRRPVLLKENKIPKMAQGWINGRRWEDEPATSSNLATSINTEADHAAELRAKGIDLP